MSPNALLLGSCATLYLALTTMIVWRTRRREPLLLAVCCLVTAGWAGAGLLWPEAATTGINGGADLVRALAWFGFVYYLYCDAGLGTRAHVAGFGAAGLCAAAAGAAALLMPVDRPSLFSLIVMARLGLAVTELLLIENLYLNLPSHARWHVALPSVLLGALACFDIVLCADMAVFHAASGPLIGARTLGMIIIAPLLMVAAARGQRRQGRMQLSRSAVFHSATLVLSGGVLLALAVMGEVFRHLDHSWGWLAEAGLAFAALIAIGLMLTSASARSRIHRLVVDHFFVDRYDYRREWLACIRTLAGDDGDRHSALPTRAVRTLASLVDSPAGLLLLRDGGTGPFGWAGSWNMPSVEALPAGHPVAEAVRDGSWIARLDGDAAALLGAPLDGLGPLWLAVPLVHREQVTGLVLLAPPRAPFPLEQEVFDLLRVVGQEVATYLAEQQMTQVLLQTRQMHDYGKRFAFVAHDIKNVSSQLALLLSNAQTHISNPAFQQDMLDTVGASVRKITALLERLERPEVDRAPAALAPLPRLEALVGTYRRVRGVEVTLDNDGSTGAVAMGVEAFETALTHLLNNAVEASGGRGVMIQVRHEARQVVIDVIDGGPGMSAEFVRDELFRPFSTSKASGSGIGAFQARELVREAGGELVAISQPGAGTTMRLLLPRTGAPGRSAAEEGVAGVPDSAAPGLAVPGLAVPGLAVPGLAARTLSVAEG